MASKVKLDAAIADAVDEAREAATAASAVFSVGNHLGCVPEDDRVATHMFECTHPGYPGWRWSVTMARASRARRVTVSEVVLRPGDESLVAPDWVPWSERLRDGDIAPGTLLPTPDNDPRLEPGFSGGEHADDPDPAEAAIARAVVAELGLGRERLLSEEGRAQAAERWLEGEGGPDNQMTRQAPGPCATCGYFIRLQGRLGVLFGACGNQFSPSDGRVVSVDHGCGGHSDTVAEQRTEEVPAPVWDTIGVDHSLFD